MKVILSSLLFLIISIGISPVFAATDLTLNADMSTYEPGERVNISGKSENGQLVSIQVKDPTGKSLLVRTISANDSGNYSLGFKIPMTATFGDYSIIASVSQEMVPQIKTISITVGEKILETEQNETEMIGDSEIKSQESVIDESVCGSGTIMKDGKCVVAESQSESAGGGCLIATATYGSELAPQVQKLREIRDSKLLQTESGESFMESFNQFYYSFSPVIADYERENPYFKEMVKIGVTPLLTTLSLMDYAESESEVLTIGIGLIILNGMMYVGIPAIGIIVIRRF